MAVKLDSTNTPVVDWFNESTLQYITTKTNNNKALPKSDIICYGKFKDKSDINPYYYDDITEEELKKFGDYLKTLVEPSIK